jgi:hypothetical protein
VQVATGFCKRGDQEELRVLLEVMRVVTCFEGGEDDLDRGRYARRKIGQMVEDTRLDSPEG